MKNLYPILLLLLVWGGAFGQEKRHYKQLMADPDATYFDVKKAFEADEKVREKLVRKAERRARWGIISEQQAEAIEEQIEEEEVHFYRWEKFMRKSMDKDGKYDHTNTIKEYEKFLASQSKSNLRVAASPKWSNIGPLDLVATRFATDLSVRGIGRIGVIECHPTNSNIIYAGSAGYSGGFPSIALTSMTGGGGLWKSIDAGKTWLPLIDNQKNLNVMDISIDPSNPETVYAIWADGTGIWKSADGGKNWTNIPIANNANPFVAQSQTRMFSEVIVDPKNSQHLILSSGNGVFTTTDGGANWSKSTTTDSPDTQFFGIFDLEIKPGDGNIVYATNHQAFLYKSTDGGKTFIKNTTLTQFAAGSSWRYTKIAVSASVPSSVFIAGGNEFDNRFMGIVRSDNEGSTFSAIKAYGANLGTGSDEGLRTFSRNFAFAVSPINPNLMTVGGIYLNASTDGGNTFKFIGKNIHADIADVKYQPVTGRHLVGCDGGLFEMQANDVALNLNSGMATTQIDHIDVSPHKPNTFVIGTQDNGTIKYEDGKWEKIQLGDGLQSKFDPKDPNLIWTNLLFTPIQLRKIATSGITFVSPPIRANYQTNNIFNGILYEFDKNSNYMYVAVTNKLSRTNNGGQTWETLSTLTDDDPKYATATYYNERFMDLAIAPSNPSVIYAITDKGTNPQFQGFETKLMRSDDGGKTWNVGTKASFNNLTVHPTDPKTLWVTFLNFVWKSIDGGEKWADVTRNLPNIPKFAMKYHEGTNDGIYVGTAIGVYYKDNSMADWVLWGEGMPGTLVTDIEIDYLRSKVIAGTYGRGLWEADLAIKNGTVAAIENNFDGKCAGTSFAVNFSIAGRTLATNNTYRVELSNAQGSFANPTNIGQGAGSPVSVSLPANLAAGGGYAVRIVFNNEPSEVITTPFAIKVKPTATLTTATPNITLGSEAKLTLTFAGSPPFTYAGTNGISGTATQNSVEITVKPDKDITYALTSVSNACGSGTFSGEAKITITPFTTKISDVLPQSLCPNTAISVTFTTEGTAGNGNKFGLQLSNAQDTNYQDLVTTTEGNTLKATIPANTPAGTGYKVRITTSSPAASSGSSAASLTVKPLPTAAFESSTALSIQQYSPVDLKITLTGDAPWKVGLSDGKTYDAASSPASVSLSPNASTDYTLTSVSNVCGNGTVSSTALKITVIPVLSVGSSALNGQVAVYPNPTDETLTIDFDGAKRGEKTVELLDVQGRSLQRRSMSSTSLQMSLKDLPAGTYYLKIRQGEGVVTKKIIKN